tara:strand:- start:425 stop:760 length:336 start_codon:yes stop_codon:yes gene_type:complete
MKKLTGNEIIAILEDNISTTRFAEQEYKVYGEEVFDPIKLGLGEIKSISSQAGDIGNTSYAHEVFLFVDHDVHIKLKGWYSSYSGTTEWDEDADAEYSVVEPRQKTITIWE